MGLVGDEVAEDPWPFFRYVPVDKGPDGGTEVTEDLAEDAVPSAERRTCRASRTAEGVGAREFFDPVPAIETSRRGVGDRSMSGGILAETAVAVAVVG